MVKKKTAKRKIAIQINRSKEGNLAYAHVFDEIGLQFQSYSLAIKDQAIRQSELRYVKKIDEYLQTQKPLKDWVIKVSNFSIYRVVDPGRNPISCIGSFSCGGRVNIGTPQSIKDFEARLKPMFGLYGSVELGTAKAEYDSAGLPSSLSMNCQLKFKNQDARLFDFDAAVESIGKNFTEFSLFTLISEVPYNAAWMYQKWPKVSQVIGSWLRTYSKEFKVNGIIFNSTKKSGGRNVYLFFDSDSEAHSKLDISLDHSIWE